MRSEIIILLVLASFTQGSYAPTLKITYHRLSQKQMAVLNKIIEKQETATSINYKATKSFFASLCDVKAKPENALSRMFDKVEDVIDISFDSLLIALKRSCFVVESARSASRSYVNDAMMHFNTSIYLARSGNHDKNHDAIEAHRVKVKKDATNAVGVFYNATSSCLHTTSDAEARAVIKDANKGSLHGLVYLVDAIFNAIKVKATGFTPKCKKQTCMSKIQEFENKVLAGVSDNIEYKFTLLKTHYLYSQMNRGGILSKLFSNQYALTASYRGYKEGNTVVFDRIIDYLREIHPERSNNGTLDSSQDDLAMNTAIAFFNYADGANFASILALHPDATSAIATARENVFNANAEVVRSYFDAIHVAAAKGANYSYVTNYIAASKNAAAAAAPIYVREYVRVIRQNQIFDAEMEDEFARLTEMMINGSVYCTDSVLNAIGILAEAMHANEVRPDDFSRVRDLLDASNAGCGQFTQGVSAVSFLVLVANDAN